MSQEYKEYENFNDFMDSHRKSFEDLKPEVIAGIIKEHFPNYTENELSKRVYEWTNKIRFESFLCTVEIQEAERQIKQQAVAMKSFLKALVQCQDEVKEVLTVYKPFLQELFAKLK